MTMPRAVAPPQQTAKQKQNANLFQQLKKKVDAHPWVMYDTFVLGTTTVPGGTASGNTFAGMSTPIPFFSTQQRLLGTQNGVYCTNGDINKMEMDFVCRSIGVDVFCSTDTPSAAGISTCQAFVETVVQFSILRVDFGGDPQLLLPVSEMPAGGGVYAESKVRTQAIATNTDSGVANNGFPDYRAISTLEEPLVFPKGQAFTMNMHIMTDQAGTGGALARLQGLQPLTGNFNALIRVKLRGKRGKSLLLGVTQGPENRFIWSDPRMWR